MPSAVCRALFVGRIFPGRMQGCRGALLLLLGVFSLNSFSKKKEKGKDGMETLQKFKKV